MYIIAIGWLYIIILMAATEKTVVAGLMTLIFYGLAPTALFLWLVGTPAKRRAAARARLPQQAVDDVVGQPDGHDAGHDQ